MLTWKFDENSIDFLVPLDFFFSRAGMQQTAGILEPIHKWIPISSAEKQLIDSPFVQRLRWLSQLGMTSFVFPGGVHNRFSHSLGVMHLAGKWGSLLFDDPFTIQALRIAGLLHDIGHGPFSHTWDKQVYSLIYPNVEKGHDEQRIDIVLHAEVKALIYACGGVTAFDVVRMWQEEPYKSILQGEIGCDRMDYMLRDAYYTGTLHFGTMALERIINNAAVVDNRLVFRAKVEDEIKRALEGREYMYRNVYLHHAVIDAEAILNEMLQKAMALGIPLKKWTEDLEEFKFLTEHKILGICSAHPKLFPLYKRLIHRDLKNKI